MSDLWHPVSELQKLTMMMRKRTPAEKSLKIIISITMILSICLSLFILGFYVYSAQTIPSIDALKNFAPPTITRFYADDGELIGEFFAERREVVSLSHIPRHLVLAFVAGEDSRFFQHKGLDLLAILRALARNVFSGEIVQGGSTITQQVVKSLILSPEKSLTRKVREAILAYKIETHLTKDEILHLYLNQIYLGHGAYGLGVAAETYFGKPVDDLNLAESALLAGLPRATSRTSPFQNPEQAKRRQVYILNRMVEEGFISAEECAEALQTPLRVVSRAWALPEKSPYFVEHVRKYVEEKYGREALYQNGLKVYTTIDLGVQKAAEEALQAGLKEIEKRHKYPSDARPEGALLSFDLEAGYIRAMVGGSDFSKSQFNRATQARRQTGSAFKPIIYASALDKNFTPASVIVDAPLFFEWGNRRWRPRNFGDTYRGPTTLRNALTHSLNTVTVRLAQELGVPYIVTYARSLGISSPLQNNLSMALGSSGISLYELSNAYAVFANQGRAFRPRGVKKILDRHGNLLEENLPYSSLALPPQVDQVISPQTAYLMTSLLESVVQEGTGWRAKALGRPVAGKTGTTDHFMDAWFIGYTPDVLTGVWVGFDDETGLGENETGNRAALPIWLNFMTRVLRGKAVRDFPIPEGLECLRVDPVTGEVSYRGDAILECFKEGTGPFQFMQVKSMTSSDFFKFDFNSSSTPR